jgi:hypothetical protein
MTVPWAEARWARIVQPSGSVDPPPLRWRSSDHEMLEPALDSRHGQRSDGTDFEEPYGSMTPATLERQLVRDNTSERHRRLWPFRSKGPKTQPSVMDPDERPDVDFWSRRWKNN